MSDQGDGKDDAPESANTLELTRIAGVLMCRSAEKSSESIMLARQAAQIEVCRTILGAEQRASMVQLVHKNHPDLNPEMN